jgi:hypothetical protein
VLYIMSELRSMGMSQVLRERGKATWMAAVSHPMVWQIGDGTLPLPAFRRDFGQDVPCLIDCGSQFWDMVYTAPPRGGCVIQEGVRPSCAQPESSRT